MAYDDKRGDFTQERFWIAQIKIPKCTQTFGVGLCGATGEKCYNTSGTCTFLSALTLEAETVYQFSSKRAPMPTVVDWHGSDPDSLLLIPSMPSMPQITYPQLDLTGGLGIRGGVSLTLVDHPFNDVAFGADPYLVDRSFNPEEVGTFWPKFVARDPFYVGREITVYDGFLDDGKIYSENFKAHTYLIEKITLADGKAAITAKDILKAADNDRAQYPQQSNAELAADITNSDTSLTITYEGADIDTDFPLVGGKVRIGEEVIAYASRTGTTLSGLTRAENGTFASDHTEEADVQLCAEFDDQVDDIIYEFLTVGAGIDPIYIDQAAWQQEIEQQYPSKLSGIITEPAGVKDLLAEIGNTAQTYLWWDASAKKIQLRVSQAPNNTTAVLDTESHLLANGLSFAAKPDSRISQVWVYYGVRNAAKELKEPSNYELLHVRADLQSESDQEYDSSRVKTIYSRWITRNNKTAAVLLATKLGQRFGATPREATFTVSQKDADFDLADPVGLQHRLMVKPTGEPLDVFFEITSRKDSGVVQYKALEHPIPRYLPDDPANSFVIYIQEAIDNAQSAVNLRELYDGAGGRFPLDTVPPVEGVVFIVEAETIIAGRPGIETGDWTSVEAAAGQPILVRLLVEGSAYGHGGDAPPAYPLPSSVDGQAGGTAISLGYDLQIDDVTGLVAAGGGSGASGVTVVATSPIGGGGGGGAPFGLGGAVIAGSGAGTNATETTGGNGGTASSGGAIGGDGGDINQPGLGSVGGDNSGLGGAAGSAIEQNGYTLTIISGAGNIVGAINP